ncbi:MAG: hypothetical protein HY654_08040 [Acidobacteria bacterium]|nr:hypothetical protein [Acidobacteriota bacterium]
MAEVLLGIGGPLVSAAGSWLLLQRTSRRDPARLTSVILKLFGAKMIFFGAYVIIVVSVLRLRPVPFVIAFTVSFILLLFIEARALSRLSVTHVRRDERRGA